MRRPEVIEVVAGYFTQHLWKARFDLGLLARVEISQLRDDLLVSRRPAGIAHRAKLPALAADRARLDGENVVNHVAVGDRARTARVVTGHAADRRLRARRDVDREPETLRPQRGVQLIEHDTGLHDRALAFDFKDPIQVLRAIDDQRLAHRLAA